jgi:two-component system, sensor histidine kinase and response regulator
MLDRKLIDSKQPSFVTPPKQAASPSKILVAEDDKANQIVISFWLEKFGYDFELVASGEDAITKFRTGQFSIILMDIKMGDMDGYEVTKSIREIEKKSKLKPSIIIAFTARAFLDDKIRCLASGMNEYFSKPVDYDALKICISKYI